jgi:hypothetical protein
VYVTNTKPVGIPTESSEQKLAEPIKPIETPQVFDGPYKRKQWNYEE